MPELNQSNHREFVEKLAEEFLERFRAGQQPSWHEYAAKHPDHAKLIGELFPTLIAVEGLAENSELEGDTTQDHFDADMTGALIGPYKLLQQIGAGGMGVVYMAEQKEPIKRRVALKIIKPGMDSRQFVARFEAERQALAMMDHPNIARILDVGTVNGTQNEEDGPSNPHSAFRIPHSEGRPYFVMELVMGVPITKYCNEHRLTPRERLELFVPICQAVQHAHQKGIIHRDLKPSNILVAEYDLKPVPKIIDFGLAKALHQQLTEKTLFTQFGQLVGTWEYMSPEQARLNQLDVDTRSDIYSLGVLLYELLTGHTPFDRRSLRSAAFDEILRIIRDVEPPRPSAKLSASGTLPSVAANCSTEPKKLMTLVRSDLDVIVMKALEKDRGRRYATATAFADDVERFLNYEPVQARRPSPAYRVQRFVRRNRTAVAVAGLVLLSLVAGVIGTTIQWQRAVVAERSERAARQDAVRTAEENVDLAAKETTARKQLERLFRKSNATRLAAHSDAVRQKQPIQSLLLALQAVEATRAHDGSVLPAAHAALLNANAVVGGRPFPGHEAGIAGFAATPDGRWMATVDQEGTARVFDLTAADREVPRHVLTGARTDIWNVKLHSSGRWLGLGTHGGPAQVWDLASDYPQSSLLEFHAHSQPCMVNFSLDGRLFVSSSFDRTARLYDLTSNQPTEQAVKLVGHQDVAAYPVFSSDSRWLFTGSNDGTVRVWDARAVDPSKTARFVNANPQQAQIEISPDGNFLAVASYSDVYKSHGVELWNVSNEGDLSRSTHLESPWMCKPIAISPNNRWVVAACADLRNDVYLWDLEAKDPVSSKVLLAGHQEKISLLTFSPNGRWLITGSADNTVRLWNLREEHPGKTPLTFAGGHDYRVLGAVMTPDSDWLITVSSDGARKWNLRRKRPDSSPLAVPGPTTASWLRWRLGRSMAISPDARWLATTDADSIARLWSLSSDGTIAKSYVLGGQDDPITAFAIGPMNRWFAFGTASGDLTLWDLTVQSPETSSHKLQDHVGEVQSIAVSPNGRWLITASADTTVRLWDLTAMPNLHASSHVLMRPANSYPGVQTDVAAISPGSRWVVTQYDHGRDFAPRLWNIATTNPNDSIATLPGLGSPTNALVQSTSGRWLLWGGVDNTVVRWDLAAVDPIATVKVFGELYSTSFVRSLAASSDGRWVFIGRWLEGYAPDSWMVNELWDLVATEPEKQRQTLRPLDSAVAAGISPNNRWLVVSSENRKIHLWDLAVDDLPTSHRVLVGQTDNVEVIKFSADSRWLFTCDGSTTRMWDLNVDSLIERARRVVGRDLTPEEEELYLNAGRSDAR